MLLFSPIEAWKRKIINEYMNPTLRFVSLTLNLIERLKHTHIYNIIKKEIRKLK